MIVHLVDGTYELYRQFYGQLGRHSDEHEYAGVIGALSSTLQLIEDGSTHIGVAAKDEISSALVALGAAVAVAAVYAVLHKVSPSSLGWGDVLLVVPLALAVGYVALDRVAVWQLLASVTGALHALVARRLRGTRSIPFGPHLLLAAWLVLLASV